MRSLRAIAAALALAAAPAWAGDMHRIEHDGRERSYYVHAPTLPANARPPLVFMLHGAGGTGDFAVRRYKWDRKADAEGFVVAGAEASPSFPGTPANFAANPRVWNDGSGRGSANVRSSDDVGFVAALIDRLTASHGIDHRRVYVVGFSSGAGMAQRIGQELADRIAAIAPVAGIMIAAARPPSRAIPVLYLSGDRDPLNPVEGGTIRLPWGGVYPKEAHAAIVTRWRDLNRCPPTIVRTVGPPDVVTETAGPCRDGVEVRYVLVRGLGHRWAGAGGDPLPESLVGPDSNAIDATDLVWDFLKRWRLPER